MQLHWQQPSGHCTVQRAATQVAYWGSVGPGWALLAAGAAWDGPLDGTAGAAWDSPAGGPVAPAAGGVAAAASLLLPLLPASDAAGAPAAGALLTLLELPVLSRPPLACGRLGLQPQTASQLAPAICGHAFVQYRQVAHQGSILLLQQANDGAVTSATRDITTQQKAY